MRLVMDGDGLVERNFNKLVKQIEQCGSQCGKAPYEAADLAECTKNVYGRIVAEGGERLQYLSSSKDRKTVFLFGEDAITSLVLRKSPYDALIELGFTPEYIQYKVVTERGRILVVYNSILVFPVPLVCGTEVTVLYCVVQTI